MPYQTPGAWEPKPESNDSSFWDTVLSALPAVAGAAVGGMLLPGAGAALGSAFLPGAISGGIGTTLGSGVGAATGGTAGAAASSVLEGVGSSLGSVAGQQAGQELGIGPKQPGVRQMATRRMLGGSGGYRRPGSWS